MPSINDILNRLRQGIGNAARGAPRAPNVPAPAPAPNPQAGSNINAIAEAMRRAQAATTSPPSIRPPIPQAGQAASPGAGANIDAIAAALRRTQASPITPTPIRPTINRVGPPGPIPGAADARDALSRIENFRPGTGGPIPPTNPLAGGMPPRSPGLGVPTGASLGAGLGAGLGASLWPSGVGQQSAGQQQQVPYIKPGDVLANLSRPSIRYGNWPAGQPGQSGPAASPVAPPPEPSPSPAPAAVPPAAPPITQPQPERTTVMPDGSRTPFTGVGQPPIKYGEVPGQIARNNQSIPLPRPRPQIPQRPVPGRVPQRPMPPQQQNLIRFLMGPKDFRGQTYQPPYEAGLPPSYRQ